MPTSARGTGSPNTGHPAFGAPVFEVWGALLNGGRLAVVDSATLLHPPALEEFLRRAQIFVLWPSAGVLHQCARARPAVRAALTAA